MVFVDAGDPIYALGVKDFHPLQGVNVRIHIKTEGRLLLKRPTSFIRYVKSVSVKTPKSDVVKSLIFSLSGVKVSGGVSDPETLRNTEKVIGDFRKLFKENTIIVPTMIRKCFGASMLLLSEHDGNITITGLVSSDVGDRVIVSPTLIPPILKNKKIIDNLCEELSSIEKRFRPDIVLHPLFSKKNPYVNTGPVFVSSITSSPKVIKLQASVRSGGVIRPIDALIGVDEAGVFDYPGNLYVSFVKLGDTVIPVFRSVGEHSIVFTPDKLKDKRHFAFVVGMRIYKSVSSDKVRVFSDKVAKGGEEITFGLNGDTVKLVVSGVSGNPGGSKILWMRQYGGELFEGKFDNRIVHLRPVKRTFHVGVMFSDDGKAFIPMFFTSGGIKGYLVDLEDAVINRAVIDV